MVQDVHSERRLGPTDLAAIGTIVLHDHVERFNMVLEVVPLFKGPGTRGALPTRHTEL
jgi:hypothetical protein